MGIFKLQITGQDISEAELVEAPKTSLDLEKHLESWLERSPWALAEEPFLWISRQSTANLEQGVLFPDLLGLDRDGNIVIVELKKGRAPREVIAQLLEYATWAHGLTEEAVQALASGYFSSDPESQGRMLQEVFCETFEAEEMPPLNSGLRLFLAAEDFPPSISRVCHFLRTEHGLDVNCIRFSVHQTASGEIVLSTESVLGGEVGAPRERKASSRWSGDKPVRQVVWEAVDEFTKGDDGCVFATRDIIDIILKKYPTFNKSTIGCQIISDCVNHTSRHHYPGGEDRYWWLERGRYRLYDPSRDGAQGAKQDRV